MKKTYLLLLILLFSIQSRSQDAVTAPEPEIGIFERLDQFIPEDIVLLNEDSVIVNLKTLVDKPTFVAFVYYNCPGLCSPLLDGISEIIGRSDLVLGVDYQMITISMNYDDTPSLGKKKKANYVAAIGKEVDSDSWKWLTGDSATVQRITHAMGFKFKREGVDFIHTAGLIGLSPQGKITRYLHGTYFLPFDLKMATIEASQEKSGQTISKVLKFCFSYDPQGQKYVLNVTKISGTIILTLALGLLFTLIFKKNENNNNSVSQSNE